MAFQLSDDPNAALKQEITQAVALGSEADMDRLAERLKFANMAGATVNQLVERERDLNVKRHELDVQLQVGADRERLRAAKAQILEDFPEYRDEQLYSQVLVPFDSQLAQSDPNLDFLPRLREAAEAGRRYLNGRNGAELDSDAYIQQRIADGKERGKSAPEMQSQNEVQASDYRVSSEDRWHSSVIAKMKAQRLRGQGRGADGEALEVDDEVDDED